MHPFELVLSYLLGATLNLYKNVTCKGNDNFKFMNFEIQGPFQDLLLKMDHFTGHFQDKIKSQEISRSGYSDVINE